MMRAARLASTVKAYSVGGSQATNCFAGEACSCKLKWRR